MDRTAGHLSKKYQEAVSSLVWAKLVGIGSAGTGKTCLIKHFCESKMSLQRVPLKSQTDDYIVKKGNWITRVRDGSGFNTGYQPTVGVDYGFKIQTVNGTEMRVHMWDLSGSNEYMDVRNELYNGSDAIFVTYDVTNATTFEALDGWLQEAHRFATGNPDIFIVGNKTDLSKKRTVPSSEGKKFALQNRCLFFETSAATGEGMDTMFDQILQEIAKKRKSTSANFNKRSR